MASSDPAKRSQPQRRPAFSANDRVGSRGAVTHARLLRAGLAVLDAEGYHGTRVEAITERVGCSRPTFYQYFADKADFFFQLATRVDGELATLARDFPPVAPTRSSRDALRDWLARFEELRRSYAPVFRFEALLRSDPRIGRGSEERILATGRILASAVEAPLPTRAPPALLGALAYGTIAEAFGSASGRVAEERLVEGAADWLHRCLLGPLQGVNTAGRSRPARNADRAERAEPTGRSDGAGTRGAPAPPSDLGPKAARSRARLVEAAREVFGRLGYEGTRVDDVASAASMSHGAFYRYFSGKEEIFREIATPAVDDVLVLLEALPDPRGGLHAWARRLYQTYAIHCGLFAAWAESATARAALAPELGAAIESAAARALGGRSSAERPVDALLLLAHVERAPYIVHAYPSLAEPEAITATGEILERGFFGRERGPGEDSALRRAP